MWLNNAFKVNVCVRVIVYVKRGMTERDTEREGDTCELHIDLKTSFLVVVHLER